MAGVILGHPVIDGMSNSSVSAVAISIFCSLDCFFFSEVDAWRQLS
jgi:hypothetical protein